MCARNFFHTFSKNHVNSCSTVTLRSTWVLYQPGTWKFHATSDSFPLCGKITRVAPHKNTILFRFALSFKTTTSTLLCCSLRLLQLLPAVPKELFLHHLKLQLAEEDSSLLRRSCYWLLHVLFEFHMHQGISHCWRLWHVMKCRNCRLRWVISSDGGVQSLKERCFCCRNR